MRITLLASDESSAPLYRVRILAQVLSRFAEVEVLGFHFGPLDPGAPRDFPYRGFAARRGPAFRDAVRALAQEVHGDVLYAMKPRPSSFGTALWLGWKRRLPVVVDIDDWEPAMIAPYSRHAWKNALWALGRLGDPNNYLFTRIMEPCLGQAAGLTTVSTHFQQHFGGILAPQYVDTDRFDPARFEGDALKAEHRLGGRTVVLFLGIAQPNKGLLAILEALQRLGDRPWTLAIVGPVTPHARELSYLDRRVKLFGTQPPEKAPAFLAMADLVALPQRAEPANLGQMPMKLFEAMAMARPVVATAMADIPAVLEGCGVVVPPGAPAALSAAIDKLLDDPSRARELGARARHRIQELYSYGCGAASLGSYFEAVRRRHDSLVYGGSPC